MKKAGPYHYGNLEEALIELGLKRLEEGGEAAINLRDMARDLAVSSGAPYRHFKDKADLLDALSLWGWQRFREGMEASPDFVSRVAYYRKFGADRPQLLTQMLKRCGDEGPRGGAWSEAASGSFATLSQDISQICGNVPFRDRVRATVIAWALIHGVATLEATPILEDFGEVWPSDQDIVDLIYRSVGGSPNTA